MGWPDLTYRSRIEPELRNELELLVGLTQGFLASEHGADGQHTTITVDGIQFRGREGQILATISVIDGVITITFPPSSPPGADPGLQVNDVLVGHHHGIPGAAWDMRSGIDLNTDAPPDLGNRWLIGVGTDAVTGAGASALVFGSYLAANTIGGGPALYYAPSLGGYAFCPPASGSAGVAYRLGHPSDTRLRWDAVNALIVDASAGYRERGRTVGQGDWIDVPFNAANFAGSAGSVVTVDAADQTTFAYTLVGQTMTLAVSLNTISIGGGPTAEIFLTIPAGLLPTRSIVAAGSAIDNGVRVNTIVVATPGFSNLTVYRSDTAAWQPSAHNTAIYVQIVFPF